MEKEEGYDLMRRNTLPDLLRKNHRRFSEKNAVTCYQTGESTPRKLSYRELNEAANRFANSLYSIGCKEHDVVAIMCHNCIQFVIAAWGLLKANVIGTLVNVNLVDHEVLYQVEHSDAKIFLVEDMFVEMVQKIRHELPKVQEFGVISLSGGSVPQGWFDVDELYSEKYSSQEPMATIDNDDVAIRVYTSGTTAFPKAIDLTYSNLEYISRSYVGSNGGGQTVDSVFGYFIPLYHSGILHMLASTSLGSHLVVGSLSDMAGAIEIIEAENVTATVLPVTMFRRLINSPLKDKLKSLQMAWWFGGAMPLDVLQQWFDYFPNIRIAAQWSQSECLVGTISWYDKTSGLPPSGNVIGKPYLDTEIKIINTNDEEVPDGEVGEIVMRSPAIMKGYYKNEEATKEAFRNGWHHTGDVGCKGADGDFYFIDRLKDMIKTGGVNVSAMEVEAVLNTIPGVENSAAFGVYHPDWTEAVAAAVVTKKDSLSEKEIQSYCKKNMAAFKVPKRIVFVDEVPISHIGKILRRELREKYKDLFRENKGK